MADDGVGGWRRFDLVCKSLSTDAKYPGLSIAEGNEEKVTRTAR